MDGLISKCPSCGAKAAGVYCHHCGEKVLIDSRERTLSYFIRDAFEEVFSLDSKFITTVRSLLTKPGFLTNEILAGRRVNYIKPFKLYTIFVVVHFIAFTFFQSGDIFSIDRMPFFRIFPGIPDLIHSYEVESGQSHAAFAQTVNQNLKDNLNIVFYFLVFILAGFVQLVFFRSGRYYIEHLYYLLHLVTFGLIRNILLIPVVILDWIPVAFVLAAISQIVYTWYSLKNVYRESNGITLYRLVVVIFGFLLVFMPAITLSLWLALIQSI